MDITQSSAAPKAYINTYKNIAGSANGGAVTAAKSSPNTDRVEFSNTERILPERYKEEQMAGKMYYQGKLVTSYELLETAVKTGAVTLDETQTVGYNQSLAVKALIESKASPAFSWSSTLYSEDRMYVFRVENGQITGAHRAYFDDGTTFFDVAKEIASGKMLCDIDPCKLDELRRYDPELFEAAQNIGKAKRHYDQTEECYRNGTIDKKQYNHDMYLLFLMLFGTHADINNKAQQNEVKKYFTRHDFAENALRNYSIENVRMFNDLLASGFHTYSGLF